MISSKKVVIEPIAGGNEAKIWPKTAETIFIYKNTTKHKHNSISEFG